MNDFFTSIYSWFCDSSLIVFKIMGAVWVDDEEVLSSSFPLIGFTAAVISIIAAIAFYIWPINHPRFKAWWAWLIMLLGSAVINFGLAFAFINHRILVIEQDAEALELFTEDATLFVPTWQWSVLALSNACVSAMFFIMASLIFNWFSSNCRFSPFRK